jgi:hypothetical protein
MMKCARLLLQILVKVPVLQIHLLVVVDVVACVVTVTVAVSEWWFVV